jgi:competence protein ComEC
MKGTSYILILFLSACMHPQLNPFEINTNDGVLSENKLRIIALDVGQGDATLVIGPSGKAGLIDAGPPLSGLLKILPTLRILQISVLDWVILSHYDTDHLGGLLEVLKGEDQVWDTDDDVTVKDFVWDRGKLPFNPSPRFENYLREMQDRSLRKTIEPAQTFDLGHEALMTVVLSNGSFHDGSSIHVNPDEENEASIALLIEHGNFSYLTAGDLSGGGLSGSKETKDLESSLANLIGPVDIIHANHHGSKTSNNENYLDLLDPSAILISAGVNNDYGHPHSQVLERLDAREIKIYQTSTGPIEIVSDGQGFEIQ